MLRGRAHEPLLATGKDSALVLQVMGVFSDEDVKQILRMIEPEVFTEEEEGEEEGEGEEEEEDEEEKEEDEEEEAHEKEDGEKEEAEEAAEEEKEELEEGLLQMKLPESVKLQVGFPVFWPPSIWAQRYPGWWSWSLDFVQQQWEAMEMQKAVGRCWLRSNFTDFHVRGSHGGG